MLKSKSFVMEKGNNSQNFKVLCLASRTLVETGNVLKDEGILEALDAWDVRPVDFAEVLAKKPVPAEYRAYMGGNQAPTNCPDEFWASIGTRALLFRDCKQFLRCAMRTGACNNMLPKGYKESVCHLVYGTLSALYAEYGDIS